MGSPITHRARCKAQWIEVLRDSGHAPDPRTNPVIGRYAFWIDDETSKIDYFVSGNEGRNGGFEHGGGTAPIDLDIGALPLAGFSPLAEDDEAHAINRDILTYRASLPILDLRFINRASPIFAATPDLYDQAVKFYGTVFSVSDDLAFTGARRANLNTLVTNTEDSAAIAQDMQRIVSVIRHGIPRFGERFYPDTPPDDPADENDATDIYLKRLAANIRDYVDTDSQPTVVDSRGNVFAGSKPGNNWPNGELPQAVGKEAIPYLQEHAWRLGKVAWTASRVSADYTVSIDHYFEFFNPTTTDFKAPEGTFMTLSTLPSWTAGTHPPLQPPDVTLDLSGLRLPGGATIVVTTDPEPAGLPEGLIAEGSKVFIASVAANARIFSGTTDHIMNGVPGLELLPRPPAPAGSDYGTHMVWGTLKGFYDAHPCLALLSQRPHQFPNFAMEPVGGAGRFFASALRGNDGPTRSGDPRTLSEQLAISVAPGNENATRFLPTLAGESPPGLSTFGKASHSWVDPTRWPDYNGPFDGTANTAPASIRDGLPETVGELGNIFDPRREGLPVAVARGGGRTLKLGQRDDVAGGDRFSLQWQLNAWRLADLFEPEPFSPELTAQATSRGRININSVLRDDGWVLRAALRGIHFYRTPEGDPALSGSALSESDIDAFIDSAKDYILQHGPVVERGEISDFSFFSDEGPNRGRIARKSLAHLNDRGREELFRRIVGLLTTRSASFTVYGIGQAIRQQPDGSLTVLAHRRLSRTFQLDPLVGRNLNDTVTSYAVRSIYEHN